MDVHFFCGASMYFLYRSIGKEPPTRGIFYAPSILIPRILTWTLEILPGPGKKGYSSRT
jgi:hypothetical protein